MTLRLGIVLGSLLAASTAFAQAPGEVAPVAPPSSMEPAPVIVDPSADARATLMRRRFAIGLNLGGMGVAPAGVDDAAETNFRTAELSLRYRFTPRFELELLLNGGRQVLDDDTDGELAMGGGTLGARYRFRPLKKTTWWLMAGLGATVIARHDSTEEERDAASRPHLAFGIGIEHRFTNFALHAEARALAIGPRDDAAMDTTPPLDGMPVPDVGFEPASDDLSGGTFTIGASYYF